MIQGRENQIPSDIEQVRIKHIDGVEENGFYEKSQNVFLVYRDQKYVECKDVSYYRLNGKKECEWIFVKRIEELKL